MNVLKDGDCGICDGCGYVANDDERTPWRVWAGLPLQNAAAVTLGMVRPLPCPACDGSGEEL